MGFSLQVLIKYVQYLIEHLAKSGCRPSVKNGKIFVPPPQFSTSSNGDDYLYPSDFGKIWMPKKW